MGKYDFTTRPNRLKAIYLQMAELRKQSRFASVMGGRYGFLASSRNQTSYH